MDLDLTKRQKEIFDYIRRYASKHGYPPTVREIGKAVGLHSSSTVHAHLAKLESLGVLRRDPSKPRALEVLVQRAKKAVRQTGLPLVGQVAAGEPILAEENITDHVRIDSVLVGDGGRKVFALRVSGDSMIGDGIFDGDYIFVRKQLHAGAGEIVVAMIEDEATVKRFYPEGDRVRFQPSNPRLKPIYVSREDFRETQIIGVVVGVYRKMQ